MGKTVIGLYGANVFHDKIMRERLPKSVYKRLKQNRDDGAPLEAGLADVIANAMKEWAIEKGATHFCHWFQPLTGLTAEKHDSFVSPNSDGTAIM
ncbi:MAG: glutamine synthetase III, partial [Nitrospinota bacterium]